MDSMSTMRKRNRRFDKKRARRASTRGAFWKLLVFVGILAFLAMDGYKFVPRLQYWWHNRQIKQGYVAEVQKLHEEQQRLKEERDRLGHNLLTQERLAREMGYIKPGETVYKLVPKPIADAGSGLAD